MQTQTPLPPGPPRTLKWAALCLLAGTLFPRAAVAEGRSGELIYRKQCASCHGAKGEGTPDVPEPLAGDRSVEELARYIDKRMPQDAPETCVGEDARAVAAYIHEAFYSPAARARNRPARVELSRMTVRQYRNAVTDLIGPVPPAQRRRSGLPSPGDDSGRRRREERADKVTVPGDGPGLRGEYFNSRRFRGGDRVLVRIDPEVRFDFGTSGPDPEKFDDHTFSIRWEGSVLAPETGEYEFVVRTEHAARLWVNDAEQPLIDAWVKSGNDTEHRAAVHLLGGRAYPLRLEFSKATQGVSNQKKEEKPPPVKASVALLWKPPGRAEEVIPARHLTPKASLESFVVTTPFPPDDRSAGYERGTSVSRAWDQATTDAAIEAANYVAAHLDQLAGTREDSPGRAERLRAYCRAFVERAFRRPLTADQERLFVDRPLEGAPDPETGVKRVVLLALKSPRFLYRELGGGDAYDVASRLSFGLWDSLPDRELLEAAASGRLGARAEVARQAERMLADPRARSKVREFLLQWLKVDPAPDLAKDPKRFPEFDEAAASDLRASLELFLDDVVWGGERSDFRQLFLADTLYLNGRLARLYGADLPPDAPFTKVPLGPGERAGVLSHPYLLAAFAYTETSSPIHRGVFLARSVLGRPLRPPPEAFSPLAPDLHPDLTTRERVALQTRPQACMSCHGMINPLGFTLERFDAIGRYREEENGKPIDASGTYQTLAGETVKFGGARDLAAFLADSPEVHEAFTAQLFHYLVKQPVHAYGPDTLAKLRESFARNGFSVRKLMVEIMAETALIGRREDP